MPLNPAGPQITGVEPEHPESLEQEPKRHVVIFQGGADDTFFFDQDRSEIGGTLSSVVSAIARSNLNPDDPDATASTAVLVVPNITSKTSTAYELNISDKQNTDSVDSSVELDISNKADRFATLKDEYEKFLIDENVSEINIMAHSLGFLELMVVLSMIDEDILESSAKKLHIRLVSPFGLESPLYEQIYRFYGKVQPGETLEKVDDGKEPNLMQVAMMLHAVPLYSKLGSTGTDTDINSDGELYNSDADTRKVLGDLFDYRLDHENAQTIKLEGTTINIDDDVAENLNIIDKKIQEFLRKKNGEHSQASNDDKTELKSLIIERYNLLADIINTSRKPEVPDKYINAESDFITGIMDLIDALRKSHFSKNWNVAQNAKQKGIGILLDSFEMGKFAFSRKTNIFTQYLQKLNDMGVSTTFYVPELDAILPYEEALSQIMAIRNISQEEAAAFVWILQFSTHSGIVANSSQVSTILES